MFSKNLIIFFCVLLTAGCAAANRGQLRSAFDEDILDNKESIKNGSPAQAISDLSMLLEIDPKNDEARFLRALAYQKTEQYDKATEDYELLLKKQPGNSKTHYNLAMIYAFKTHDKKNALKHFDDFITLNPENPNTARVAKIMLELDEAPHQQDPAHLNRLIADILADRGIIRISKGEGDAKQRKTSVSKMARANPNSPELHFAMAKLMEQDGKFDDAIKYYEKALELRPTYAECHFHLGQLLLKDNREAEGQIHLIKAGLFHSRNL